MFDDPNERALLPFLLSELAVLVGALVILAASLLGVTSLLSSVSRSVRLAALAFVLLELFVPLWVFLDLRQQENPNTDWLHASVMPVVNLIALVGYLDEKRRKNGQ